ncbi:MAG: type VI secretion system tip protein VgrG [Gemmatimonadota bacterium]|nr:type VI secretion system tip protein VgrG [Gemmatimonadota bacterium]
MRLTTPLPDDTLMIERLVGEETVSEPFAIHLDLLSTDSAIDPATLLRKPVSVAVDLNAGGHRYFHGVIRRFVQLGRVDGLVSYRAEVVPWLWFLSLTSNCRIFQQKNVPDIARAVLTDMGVTDVKLSLTGKYAAREYCVQYRESDLAFISRLMEEEGIYYFFEHEAGKHTLVLADSPSAVSAGPTGKLRVAASGDGNQGDDVITSLEVDSEVVSGKVTLVDYNDTVPKRLESSVAGGAKGTEAYRRFDYPGKFAAVDEGDRLARLRLEESESLSIVVNGSTNYRGLRSGQKLDVAEHYRRDVNQSYHILSATHDGTESGYRSKDGESAFGFSTAFEGIPYAVPFRPAPVTPKSIVHGTQTAIVVGPAGEEIYVDKYGRVKVQFFWDQVGKKDEKSSCWVRVSSIWAGKQWGAIHTPRIGQEVVVDFLEGDPDRPIIVGRVYNAEQMPPFDLPANSSQSGVKSRSLKGGAAANFNEFRFEDKLGSEQVFLHAEKNSDIEVEKDETHWVGKDRTKTVDHDEIVHVKHDRTETVDNNETLTIHGLRAAMIDKDDTVTVKTGNRSVVVQQGNDATQVSMGNLATDVSMGNASLKVAMGNLTTDVSLGNVSLKAGVGKITYEALQGIEFKVGQNSVKIDQTGITIKGLMVSIEGQVQTELKGLMTKVNASAMLTVKGAITMIN